VSCSRKQKGCSRTEPVLVTVTQEQPYPMAAVIRGTGIEGLKFILIVVLILVYRYIIKADYKCHHIFPTSTSRHIDISKRLAVNYNKTAKILLFARLYGGFERLLVMNIYVYTGRIRTPWPLVCKRTIPTEQPPHVYTGTIMKWGIHLLDSSNEK
jgi:hypothetical protein